MWKLLERFNEQINIFVGIWAIFFDGKIGLFLELGVRFFLGN
jgi:hypothetical protein